MLNLIHVPKVCKLPETYINLDNVVRMLITNPEKQVTIFFSDYKSVTLSKEQSEIFLKELNQRMHYQKLMLEVMPNRIN